ncbi:MAG: hypothetical protein EBY22_14390 [Gammaproteobacteria bacterium]|nr:hypothetical protein [Gammaproteobacteria bacterium]
MSFLSELEYQKNSDNELIAAIYPLKEAMKHDNLLRERLGGSTKDGSEASVGSRFDGLGIPVGLYLSRKRIDMAKIKKQPDIQEGCAVIDEEKFNQLLDKIVKKSQKRLSKKNKKSMGSPIGTNKTSKKR